MVCQYHDIPRNQASVTDFIKQVLGNMDQSTLRVHVEQRVLNSGVLIKPQFENSTVNFTPLGNDSDLIALNKFSSKLVCSRASLEHKVVGEMVRYNIWGLHVAYIELEEGRKTWQRLES